MDVVVAGCRCICVWVEVGHKVAGNGYRIDGYDMADLADATGQCSIAVSFLNAQANLVSTWLIVCMAWIELTWRTSIAECPADRICIAWTNRGIDELECKIVVWSCISKGIKAGHEVAGWWVWSDRDRVTNFPDATGEGTIVISFLYDKANIVSARLCVRMIRI